MDQNTTNKTEFEQREAKVSDGVLDFLQSLAIAIAICLFIYVLIAMPNQIDGKSMNPNLDHGEIILTNKLSHWLSATKAAEPLNLDYSRGDIVVFQKKPFDDFIKRIIGLPGEKVMINEGKIYINNKELEEAYLTEDTKTKGGTFLEEGEEVIVPEDSFLVLGDNRDNSHDSRAIDIGFVKREWIKGKVMVKYWPIDKFSLFQEPNYNL